MREHHTVHSAIHRGADKDVRLRQFPRVGGCVWELCVDGNMRGCPIETPRWASGDGTAVAVAAADPATTFPSAPPVQSLMMIHLMMIHLMIIHLMIIHLMIIHLIIHLMIIHLMITHETGL